MRNKFVVLRFFKYLVGPSVRLLDDKIFLSTISHSTFAH